MNKSNEMNGCYEGYVIPLQPGNQLGLSLRIDINPISPKYPAMNRISGDFFEVTGEENNPVNDIRIYHESWIVDNPIVKWTGDSAEITGSIRFWSTNVSRLEKSIKVAINQPDPDKPKIAAVTFTDPSGNNTIYNCIKKSDWVRSITLEVDVCASVNKEPILPEYNTDASVIKPRNLPNRNLTIANAYGEAGIELTISPDRTIIDDSSGDFCTWSNAELHDAMEHHFSQLKGDWPRWELWGILAGNHDNPENAGIIFDTEEKYEGPGKSPYRQGIAVFREHKWFKDLLKRDPANERETWALRQFLFTWVHEVGHAFNMVHSGDKRRPEALSWMNYPHDYPNGENEFWKEFKFQFDEEELIHLRHGNRLSVIMGGDSWASGSHFSSNTSKAFPQVEGKLPIEFLLRSNGYFEFMEPVKIEFRLRNLLNAPINLDLQLAPEAGNVAIHIRRPDGRIIKYKPIICNFGTRNLKELQPQKPQNIQNEGLDRYSEEVFLSYGKSGFYFDEPGEYLLSAVYHGAGNIFLPSNIHRIRIGRPFSKKEDRMAQDFFSYETGMSLYLNGSPSSFLKKGMDLLDSIINSSRTKKSLLSAKLATILANSVSRPFFQIEGRTVKKVYSPDLDKAMAITKPALSFYKNQKLKSLNLAYHKLVKHRAVWLKALGRIPDAHDEISALCNDLSTRGVNMSVLDEIKSFKENL